MNDQIMHSEYYHGDEETITHYEIPDVSREYALPSFQEMEDMLFSYVFFLIS
ncbi:MAG: hypothetical protein RR614_00565 [Eubacterium sp.]